MGDNTALHSLLNEWYESSAYDPYVRELCGGEDFNNFGYWQDLTTSIQAAHQEMMSSLVRPFRKDGAILDVACGKGATSHYISRTFPEASVTGIEISEKQLETCGKNAPNCRFERMDATNMAFDSASFDGVVSVEAAFHFNTRNAFLAEAFRILKPGGWLSLADILMELDDDDDYLASMGIDLADPEQHAPVPEASSIKSVDDYEQVLQDLGFSEISIVDMTVECTDRFAAHARRFADGKRAKDEITQKEYEEKIMAVDWMAKVCRPYIRVCARKE